MIVDIVEFFLTGALIQHALVQHHMAACACKAAMLHKLYRTN